MTFDEISLEVKLQELLDHITTRLVKLQDTTIGSLHTMNPYGFMLVLKWGFDGSSEESSYKQRFSDPTYSVSHIFITCVVPVQLFYQADLVDASSLKVIIW